MSPGLNGGRTGRVAAAVVATLLSAPVLDASETSRLTRAAEVSTLAGAGWRALYARDLDAAATEFTRLTALSPEPATGWLGLGEARFRQERHDEAIAAYDAALAREESLALAHGGRGLALLAQALYAPAGSLRRVELCGLARVALERALALDPGLGPARQGLAHMRTLLERREAPLWPLALAATGLLLALLVATRSRWRRVSWNRLRTPLRAFAVSRAVVLAGLLAAPLLPEAVQNPGSTLGPAGPLLQALAGRWDSNWYVLIARTGFSANPQPQPGEWHSIGFFPLLPAAMSVLGGAWGGEAWAGVAVVNACLLLGACAFHRLVQDVEGDAIADRATWHLLLFPASVFGTVVYTESLFLLGTAGALLAARRGAWTAAALAGALAALSRPSGLVLVVALAGEWLRQCRAAEPGVRPSRWALAAALGPVAGLGLFLAYSAWAFGDPLAYVHEHLHRAAPGLQHASWRDLVHLRLGTFGRVALVLVLLQALGAAVFARRGLLGEAAFLAASALLGWNAATLGQFRYAWSAFPLFALLGSATARPAVRQAVDAACLLGTIVIAALFASWYWIG